MKHHTQPLRPASWLLSVALSASFLHAEDAPKGADSNSANYVVLTASGIDVDDSKSAWKARQQRSANFQAGIEAFHYETALKNNWWMETDARGLVDEHDYSVDFVFENPGFNRTRLGYETFRTWSDATSVEMPGNPLLLPFDPSLELDRSRFYIETTFMPNEDLDLTLRYTLRTREGEKASTMWGYATINDDRNQRRKISPSFWDLDEEHHTLEVELEQRGETTDWGAALRWDHIDYDNAHRAVDYPEGGNTDRDTEYTAQEEEMESDDLSARATVSHRVNEQLTVNAAAFYSRLDGQVSSNRFEGDSFYPNGLEHQVDADFDLDQYVVTFSALYQPAPNWVLAPSLRFEKVEQDADGLVDAFDDPEPSASSDDYKSVAAELGLRYTGFKNWTLYADALASHTEGNLEEYGATSYIERETDYDRDMAKFTLGANWYAHPKATVAFQFYHKIKDNDYDHLADNDPERYPAFITNHEQDVDNFNIRLNWRVLPNLTSITRFDYQHATIDTTGYADPLIGGLAGVESGDRERFIYSESLTWQATQRLSLYGSLNYVQDTLTTPASDFYKNKSADNTILAESEMDYFTAQLTGFYVYNDSVDLTLTATTLVSDNAYDNSAASVPYGNDLEEFSLTASVSKWLDSNKKLTLGYGYYDYNDDYTGGATDYTAHVITAKYEYRF